MARKYKRSANGQFAGGGGGGSTAKKGAAAKPKAAVTQGQKQVAKKGAQKGGAKNAVKSTAKWIKKNPRKTIAIAYVAAAVHGNVKNPTHITALKDAASVGAKLKAAAKYAQDKASDKKGIGSNRPGQGLKMARKSRGAYKIRSS